MMARHDEIRQTWNKVASLYEEKFMHLHLYDESYDYICKSISNQGSTILEIGCGPGNISKYLVSRRPDFDIYGIDNATNMIDLARKNNPSAKFDVMDCRSIDGLKSKYDGIVCGFCLPYLSELESHKLIVDSYSLVNTNVLLYISFIDGARSKSGYQTVAVGIESMFTIIPKNG